jgi:CheY-like chemotaxis protein
MTRLLFVDDDYLNREIARRMLLRLGYGVDEASSGPDAITAAASAQSAGNPYDIIFLDITMPGMDGHEAARLIREAGSGKVLIAISGLDDVEVMSGGGFDGFVQKPFTMGSLRKALESWLPARSG